MRGNHGEHWLNGVKVLEFELGTAHMDSLLAASKFKVFPWFGQRRPGGGHIILQDHGDEVYSRSIKVRRLGHGENSCRPQPQPASACSAGGAGNGPATKSPSPSWD